MTTLPWHSNTGPSLVKSGRPFIKMHGLLNDFIIVDARRVPFNPSEADIRRICDRRAGVGGDQLVIIKSPMPSDAQANVAAFVRIINTDGREVGACGNAPS